MDRRKYYIIAAAAVVLIIIFSVIYAQMGRNEVPTDVPQEDMSDNSTISVDKLESVDLEEEVNRLLAEIMEKGPQSSSNPYEYIQNSSSFDQLVALGRPALEYMFELFQRSKDDGLKEYIMASASAKIMGIFNEENGIGDLSGREWFELYGAYQEENALNIIDDDVNDFPKGAGGENIVFPEDIDRTNLEDVVSNYILVWNRSSYKIGEKAIEAHKIYKNEVKDDVTTLYMLVRFDWYEIANGVFAPVSETQASPVVMQLRTTATGYEPLGYKQSLGGAYLEQSISKMFPKDIQQLVLDEYDKIDEELKNIQNNRAKEYLDDLNRKDVSVGEVNKNIEDENIKRAIYLVQRTRPDFPDWNGTREVLVSAGEKFMGAKIQCTLETQATKSDDHYIVTLTRRWGIEIMGERPVSYWKYKVQGNKVELIESENNDPIAIIE